jgi:hypothetical protein
LLSHSQRRGEVRRSSRVRWLDDTVARLHDQPPAMRRGDRVAVMTPSRAGPATQPERYALGRRIVEERFGLDIVEMPHALDDLETLGRHPQARAADLNAAFGDPSIRAIVASIGGQDSVRVLPFGLDEAEKPPPRSAPQTAIVIPYRDVDPRRLEESMVNVFRIVLKDD